MKASKKTPAAQSAKTKKDKKMEQATRPTMTLTISRPENLPELVANIREDLIRIARNSIAKNGTLDKGETSGIGTDLAMIMFINKYNKVYKATDETLAHHLLENEEMSFHSKANICHLFKQYASLAEHLARKPRKIDCQDIEHVNWLARLRDKQYNICSLTLTALYELEYKKYYKLGKATHEKNKKQIKDWCIPRAYELRREHPKWSKRQITDKLVEEEAKTKWPNGVANLSSSNAYDTISNSWLPKGKPCDWPDLL